MYAGHAEDGHAKVCELVENGFIKLKEWLEIRFQHQEHLLLRLTNSREFCDNALNIGNGSSMAVKDSSSPKTAAVAWPSRPAAPLGEPRSFLDEPGVESFNMPSLLGVDSLRAAAACAREINDIAPEAAVEDIPLPGCAPEEVLDTQSGALPAKQSPPCQAAALRSSASAVKTAPAEAAVEPVQTSHTSPFHFQEQDWQSKLMDVFDQLDLDRSGSIDKTEFAEAFEEVGLPPMAAFGAFSGMDKTDNGAIDRIEWLHVIEEASRHSTDEDVDMLVKFIERLADRQTAKGRIYSSDRTRRPCGILRHDSYYRMAWDLTMMLLLLYVSLTLPFSLGFGQDKTLDTIDRIFDMIFCVDVALNFRTSYLDQDETVVVSGRKIACKYLKSWFLLDFMSSMPFDLITAGLMPSLTPARLLKIGKIAKVMKLLRISKMVKVFSGSEVVEKLEEKSTSKSHQTIARIVSLAAVCFVLAHWLACFGAAADSGSFDRYFELQQELDPTVSQKYLAAMYWAMMTLSTVGYGDIIPSTDAGRLYCMVAMVVGGAFYGYIIGSVTSIVSDMDINARAYYDRMDLIQSWLDNHDEIPKLLRRRVRKHFKHTLATKSAIDDTSVTNELSPELRADTAFFIIHEQVRRNPMFYDISNSALAPLVGIVQKNHSNQNEFIVKAGDPGIAMYILVEGAARFDKGIRWRPPDYDGVDEKYQQLFEGDSFGEEIIFGLEESYKYTIITISPCTIHSISEDGFQDQYKNMPDLRNQMFASFMLSQKKVVDIESLKEDEHPEGDHISSATSKPSVLDNFHGHGLANAAVARQSSSPSLGQKPYRKKNR